MARGPNKAMQKRMAILLIIVFATSFLALSGRLVKLQIVDAKFYQAKAIKQQLSVTTINANRGTIYDTNLKTLAQSDTVWDVYVSSAYLKADDAKRKSIAADLSKILSVDGQTIYQKLKKNTNYEVIAKKVEKSTADVVRKYKTDHNIDCIGLVEDSKRYYPFGNFASQVLGFTGTDNQGLNGVEAYYDSYLEGTPGKMVSAKNAAGTDMPYDYEDYIAAKDGSSIVLTVDEVVQHYLEKNLQQAMVDNNVGNRVTGIVMDVNTGAILAMATVPGYDPNNPYQLTDDNTLKTLSGLSGDALKSATKTAQEDMWRNKAITEPYEPGSTFKIITSAAALEEKAVTESDTFFCGGQMTVAGTVIHCWKSGGHGSETFLQGLENSCNVVFMTVAARLGSANFYKYFSDFGLTEKTGVDLPGEAASLYHSQKDLGPVQLAVSSFGQSFKITPIQLITAVSAVANGGKLVQPHLLKQMLDSNGNVVKTFGTEVKRQVISKETAQELSLMLEKEVSEGTGKNAYVAGYRIAGKTGTSQKLDKDGGKSLRIASFVGFAPADNPKVAVLMLMDEPHSFSNYGGVIAAPVVGNIMSEILPYLGVEPEYTQAEQSDLDVKTPGVTGSSVAAATTALRKAGLTVSVKGSGQTVTTQVPQSGDAIPKNGTVILYTGDAQVQNSAGVPNFVGMTPGQANKAAAAAGIKIRYVGTGLTATGVKAYEQTTDAGTQVPPGTVITVKFRNEQLKDDNG